jgi:coatomer subunit beta
MMFHAFITDLPCLDNSEVIEKFPHLRQNICERLIQMLGEVKWGKVFRRVLWILGEYVKSVLDIWSTLQEIRKVLGEILILASEHRVLDEVNGGEEPDGDASQKNEKKLKERGGQGCLWIGCMPAYTSTTTAEPTLRCMLPPCFGVIL